VGTDVASNAGGGSNQKMPLSGSSEKPNVCWLRQRNSPAAAGQFRCSLKEEFKNSLFGFIYFKAGS